MRLTEVITVIAIIAIMKKNTNSFPIRYAIYMYACDAVSADGDGEYCAIAATIAAATNSIIRLSASVSPCLFIAPMFSPSIATAV